MRRVLATAAALALAGFAYRLLLREPIITWGAREEEIDAALPGDELLADAGMVSTRAITIDAPPSAVWPWLVQMGVGRGGAYTYDWIENLLGLDMHSADRIVPELQGLRAGELLPLRPSDPGMRVEILDPERTLALRSEDGDWVWAFALRPEGTGTRLLSRNRATTRGASPSRRLALAAMEPGSLVMERKMLLGIKERAERLASE